MRTFRDWMRMGSVVAASALLASAAAADGSGASSGAHASKGSQTSAPRARPTEAAGHGAKGAKAMHTGAGAALFRMIDADMDGKVSRQEAYDASAFTAGGLFFRADTNADGTVSAEEARAMREHVGMQRPALSLLSAMGEERPYEALGRMLEIDLGDGISLTEARAASRRAVDKLYAGVDVDRDGMITVQEARAAHEAWAKQAGQAAFATADKNRDGLLGREEFEAAVLEPARTSFAQADADGDGQLNYEEARRAVMSLRDTMRIGIALAPPARPAPPATPGEAPPARGETPGRN